MTDIKVGKVAMAPIESITVSNRARQQMGDLDSLEANMKETGLISPLAVMENEDGSYLLLAGERRFTVLKRNNIEQVPVRIFDHDLTEIEMKVIEKSENFYRKDMEHWELDRLTLEIHKLQQSIHGEKAPGPSATGWSTEDTGEMIGGVSKATVSQSIRRAEARDAFPELFDGCKTASDANKVLKKLDEALVKQTIAQKLESSKEENSLTKLSSCFVVDSFFESIKKVPDGVMHLVEIDPPYAIDLAKQKRKDGESKYNLNDYNEITNDIYIEGSSDPNHSWLGMRKVFKECYRVMAPHSWLLCWFAPEPWFETIYQELRKAGFGTTRMCPIWTKNTPGQTMQPQIRLANSYEMFFYAWKGQPALNKAGRGNDFNCSPVPAQQKTHPTERPVKLTTEIYDTFAFTGSRVLIPFLGSGNGLLSAQELGMSPIGFDLAQSNKDSFLVKLNSMSSFNS